MRLKRMLSMMVFLMVVICIGGCFSANPEDVKAFRMPSEINVSMDKYILQPPDAVEVLCADIPELNQQKQRIRPDGMVSFEGIGVIKAAGVTPDQLADELREKVIKLYNLSGERPVDVRIVAYKSKSYYVLGMVQKAGDKDFTGRDTVLDALAKSVPTNLAWRDHIQVIRPSADPNKKPKVFRLNFHKMMVHGDNTNDVLLQEGDIIYVPPTVLAWIGLKLDELLGPIGRSFSTANEVNPARQYE